MGLLSELRGRVPVLRLALGLVITSLLFAWMAHTADRSAVARLWAGRRPGLLAAAVLAYVSVYGCRAVRYRATGAALPPRKLFVVTVLHGFLNRVLPARGGELAYGYLVRRLGGGTFTSGMLGLIQIRIVDLVAVAGILAVALASYAGDVGLERSEAIEIALGCGVACSAAYLAVGPLVRSAARLCRALAPQRTSRARWAEMLAHLDQLADEVASTPARARVALLVASLGAWIGIYVCYWLILQGVSVDTPLSTVILGASVANLVSSLPVTAIGSFGTLEASWALSFSRLGMPASLGVATAWTISLVTLAYGACFATLGWMALIRIEAKARASRARTG